MDQTQIDRLLKLRTEAIAELDTDKFRRFCRRIGFPEPSTNEVALAGMHKARLLIPEIPEEGREISRIWLTENGYKHEITISGKALKGDMGSGLAS